MTLKVKQSKRSALRYKIPNKLVTYMANGQLGQGTLQNISTSGCNVKRCTTQLTRNEPVLIVIEFMELERPLELKARVVRIGDAEFSAEFKEIEESFIHRLSTMLARESRNF